MTVTPEMYGALCDGVSDDAPAMQAALNANGTVELTPGKTYYPRSTVFMNASWQRLVSDGTATIFVNKTYFNNNNPYMAGDARIAAVNAGSGGWSLNSTGRYGANAIVLCIQGGSGPSGAKNVGSKVSGIRFVGDNSVGLCRTVVFAKNTSDFEISDCTITGMGMGYGILIGGSKNYKILRNKIHDCLESGIYPSTSAGDAANCAPNVTAIGTTDDFIADHGVSIYGQIKDNRIDNIHFTGAGLTRHSDQSDGINLAQMGQTTLTQISGNIISSVAEGMDIFERYCLITANTLSFCNVFGIKLIYGASFNGIHNNTIINSGAAAIVLDSPGGYETRNNIGVGNILYNASSTVYTDNSLIQLSQSGSGSTHSNSFQSGEYAPMNAKAIVRNTANVGSNPANVVTGRAVLSNPPQPYVSQSTAGISTSFS